MFVYDLSLNNVKGKRNKLPALTEWLNPNFSGMGNLLFDDEMHHPKNFKHDFPEHVYQYDELIQMKNLLNQEKTPLDLINNTPENMAKFFRITNCFRSHDLLRGNNGFLCQEYNAEIVTNAWLKMFENMSFLDEILTKINKSKDPTFNTFHLAEAPGNFILAINHYLKTNYPKIEWNWMANSYRDLYSSSTHYLEDVYGLINKFRNKWLFGSDGDGDITSPANIISFRQELLKQFKGETHFVTSDVKYLPNGINYDEEENYNIPVHLGHLLSALTILSPGGTMMLKEFTFFEASSISLLYLMANCFDRLLIVKPETSKPANSEVYIFGIGYKANLTELQIERLFSILAYIRYLNNENGSPALFKRDVIPTSFVQKIIDFSKKLIDIQIPNLRKNIELYQKYIGTAPGKICRDFSVIREKMARDWIKKTQIQPISQNDKIGIEKKLVQQKK